MLEVLERCGIARISCWQLKNWCITVPNILFVDVARFAAPDFAEILLCASPMPDSEKPHLLLDAEPFSEQSSASENVILQKITYPPVCKELNLAIEERASSTGITVVSPDLELRPSEKESELYVLSHAAELFRNSREFINTISELKNRIGYTNLLYLPAIGEPANLALLVYLGVDLVDSLALILAARAGIMLFPFGRFGIENKKWRFCHCPACMEYDASSTNGFKHILMHNYHAAYSELNLVRTAICSGTLRNLVELRAGSNPHLAAILRHFDLRFYDFQEQFLPVYSGDIIASSNTALRRPEIVRFRERVRLRYRTPKHFRILLLLPCSATKPYSRSQSHRLFRKVIKNYGKGVVHEVIVTSPLGLVPRELEYTYPAQHYDTTVTGDWDLEEQKMLCNTLTAFLEKHRYGHVVIHLPPEMGFVREIVRDAIWSCKDHPVSESSLSYLSSVLSSLTENYENFSFDAYTVATVHSIARFQFGTDFVFPKEHVRGKFPGCRLFTGATQLFSFSEKKGLLIPTLEGAASLAEKKVYVVQIEDFIPEGNIFAVGVLSADEHIRPGDEVAVCYENELRAVGTALMSAKEMLERRRGMAVKVRHKIAS